MHDCLVKLVEGAMYPSFDQRSLGEKHFHVYSEEYAFYGCKPKIIDKKIIYKECGIAIACTIHKILYVSYSGDSEHSSGEIAVTVSTSKN